MMMKGYKVLLDRNSIHNSEQMKYLQRSSNLMKIVLQNVSRVECEIEENLNDVKNCLLNVENKAIKFLQMLEQDLDNYLEGYSSVRNVQENDEFSEQGDDQDEQLNQRYKVRQNKIVQDVKNQDLCCSCGFKTKIQSKYCQHMNKVHKNFNLKSSHFVSAFGNVVANPYMNQIESKNRNRSIKTPTRSRGRPNKFDRRVSEDVTKTKNRSQSSENVKSMKLSTSESLRRFNQSKEQSNEPVPETNNGCSENYYCGTCLNYFPDYKGYSLHLRSHGFIIHPSSSHIIVRRKCKPAYALAVKDAQKSSERFSCACSSHKNMSKVEYIAHVFKWHLGITPRK